MSDAPPFVDGGQYQGQRFSRIAAPGRRFSGIEFRDCTFERCAFTEATFYRCRFLDCLVRTSDLSVAQVPNSHFTGVRFISSKLTGTDWTKAGDSAMSRLLLSLDFEDCVLTYASFFGMRLGTWRLVRCVAQETDFREADLTEADFSGTDLTGALFRNTDLRRANLSTARNYDIDPTANTVSGARFSLPEAVSLLRGFDVVIE